jgi:quercetin dioxygenase-like cupin family protein
MPKMHREIFTKLEEAKVEKTEGGIFTGAVGMQRITGADALIDSKDLSVAIVSFPKGIRNTFHTHDRDQLLWILRGKGIVATENEEVSATPGMAFFIPAGERHWHGATKESDFSHISVIGRT